MSGPMEIHCHINPTVLELNPRILGCILKRSNPHAQTTAGIPWQITYLGSATSTQFEYFLPCHQLLGHM